MFSTSSILDNLKNGDVLEYKKLCRILKISKKTDKDKLDIALSALEELDIINKNEENKYSNVTDSKHIVAKIRCSSKGYCFAVRENAKEDIYIKENLLNYAWNGDKVLVRIIKDAYKRRSPEGIVDCILERSNQILLAKVEIINGKVYAIPIDDRILAKIRLPISDKKFIYNPDKKNIVKVEIDMFPICQQEGEGHVIDELELNKEKLDTEFVLSKSNLSRTNINSNYKIKDINEVERIDLTRENSFMFKSWKSNNSPTLPIIQIQHNHDKTCRIWLHTNAIAERLNLNSKKSLELFSKNYESIPLEEKWQNYLSENVIEASNFQLGKENEAISIAIDLNNNNEIINWSFNLTKVKCSFIVESKHIEALLKRKSKTRLTSRILKPIKEYVEDLDKILEISQDFRKNQLLNGKVEIASTINNIESLSEIYIHNPSDYTKEYLAPLSYDDPHTFLSPIFFEANLIWFKHSHNYNLKNASYVSQNLEYLNVSDLIRNSELVNTDIKLNDNGTLTFKEIMALSLDDNKKRVLDKLLINALRDNEVKLITKDISLDQEEKFCISPWTLPTFDFVNLINQINLYYMINSGKKSNKNNDKDINIMEKDSWREVNWDIYNLATSKIIDSFLNDFVIDKINDYKNKINQFRSNLISIKQVRKAEKLIENTYEGLIISVQSYGFFVEIPELNVEGLVHVSTLNNDWYEYRSRQNILIGRKSKKSYKIGDIINIKIIKVDILKYQIDLELA